MTEISNEIDYQLLTKEYDNEIPISYVCEVHQNQSESVTVEYFYDLVHANCSIDSSNSTGASGVSTIPLDIADRISQRLVQTAAETWKILPSGEACLAPTMFDEVWLVGVSTVTTTVTPSAVNKSSKNVTIPTTTRLVSDFGCQVLRPNTTTTTDECCHVIRSEIIFRPSGGYNRSKLVAFVNDFIDTGSSTTDDGSFTYRTASILPQFEEDVSGNDEARNNVQEPNRTSVQPPSDAAVDAIAQQSSSGRNEDITITGGFLIASFISVMVGVFIVLFRRHRKSENPRRHGMYDSTVDDTFREKGEDDDDDFQVTVVNDPHYNSFPVKRQITCRSCITEIENVDLDAVESELLDEHDDHPVSPKYAFDLGQSFKMKVMGTYAPTTIPVVAPYPMHGNFTNVGAPPQQQPAKNDMDLSGCDSEAEDSWAQTDGTVGSLEERLEEITAEI